MNQSAPRDGLALLAEAFRSRRTGVLVVGEGTELLHVRLEAGQVVALGPAPPEAKAATPLPKPNDSVRLRLERVLAEIGMRKAAATGEPQENEATDSGMPPTASLRDRLIAKLADAFHPVRFDDGAEAPGDLVAVAVATEPLILEAVRQMRQDEAVRNALGDLDQLLVATTALADERTLTLTEGYLLSRIDGLASARQVMNLVPLDPADVERTLLGLLLTGRVEGRPAPHPRPVHASPPPPVPAPAPPAPEPAAEEEAASPAAEAVPELSTEPSTEPAAEPLPEAEPVDEPVEAPADILAEPIPDDEAPPDLIPEETEEPVAAAEARKTQRLDGATLERRREILEAFQALPLKNHFEVLGVEPGCDEDEVKRAYVGLTKRFHPDAQRDKRIEDMHDILEAIFIRVQEAWEVLGEAKSRASYEARSGIVRRPRPPRPVQPQASAPADAPAASTPPPATPPPPPEAPEPGEWVPPEEILFRVRRLLAQARYWDAIQILESTLPGMEPRSQQHRGRLLLARAYSKNPNWLRRAEETLQELIREDPTNADAHFELGMVYKTGGFPARAQAMFKRALELRPGHKEASAELGILADGSPGGGGLLKRLFKRGKAS